MNSSLQKTGSTEDQADSVSDIEIGLDEWLKQTDSPVTKRHKI
jgi:hypothetical protein